MFHSFDFSYLGIECIKACFCIKEVRETPELGRSGIDFRIPPYLLGPKPGPAMPDSLEISEPDTENSERRVFITYDCDGL